MKVIGEVGARWRQRRWWRWWWREGGARTVDSSHIRFYQPRRLQHDGRVVAGELPDEGRLLRRGVKVLLAICSHLREEARVDHRSVCQVRAKTPAEHPEGALTLVDHGSAHGSRRADAVPPVPAVQAQRRRTHGRRGEARPRHGDSRGGKASEEIEYQSCELEEKSVVGSPGCVLSPHTQKRGRNDDFTWATPWAIGGRLWVKTAGKKSGWKKIKVLPMVLP